NANPTFTGTINGAAETLTGLLSGAAGTFSGLLTANGGATVPGQTLSITGAAGYLTSQSSITTTGGLFGNSLSAGGATINSAGALTLPSGSAMSLSGAAGFITSVSSINAASFFGDGSH